MKPTDFSYHLTKYLSSFLPGIRGLSSNTILSYRDTFTLLLKYYALEKKIPAEKVTLEILQVDSIREFLEWLETTRHSSPSTRNQRLASIKSFFKYLQTESSEYIYQCQQIMAIPLKRTNTEMIDYLSLDGIKAILAMTNTVSKEGRRDTVLLSILYDGAPRVQELADMKVADIRLQKPETIKLTGKGRKTRIVPIMEPTVRLLNQYITENGLNNPAKNTHPLFSNRSGNKLTRSGITYILKKYTDCARLTNPLLIPKTVSPHCFRHSKAMHLLQSGVSLIYIRDFLGHEFISTTQVYAKSDGEMKRRALEKAFVPVHASEMPIWQQNHDLMEWLKDLR